MAKFVKLTEVFQGKARAVRLAIDDIRSFTDVTDSTDPFADVIDPDAIVGKTAVYFGTGGRPVRLFVLEDADAVETLINKAG